MISGISSMSTTSLTEIRQQAFNQIDTNKTGRSTNPRSLR